MTKEKSTRLYIATDKGTGKPVALIEATSKAQSRAHLSQKLHNVEYASQSDIIAATKAGIEVEKAGEEEA